MRTKTSSCLEVKQSSRGVDSKVKPSLFNLPRDREEIEVVKGFIRRRLERKRRSRDPSHASLK